MSELEAIKTLNNPISDIISDDIYDILNSRGLIHERAVRDYRIRVKFKALRELSPYCLTYRKYHR